MHLAACFQIAHLTFVIANFARPCSDTPISEKRLRNVMYLHDRDAPTSTHSKHSFVASAQNKCDLFRVNAVPRLQMCSSRFVAFSTTRAFMFSDYSLNCTSKTVAEIGKDPDEIRSGLRRQVMLTLSRIDANQTEQKVASSQHDITNS